VAYKLKSNDANWGSLISKSLPLIASKKKIISQCGRSMGDRVPLDDDGSHDLSTPTATTVDEAAIFTVGWKHDWATPDNLRGQKGSQSVDQSFCGGL
jgi:hypothetical protein